eukprot:c32376_g1_i1.p1 GENE.c32376_g1_i1~~c32376_g1_i1.p1  ORF type:complete len:234 (-),score=8.26 c32376_g1_i1:119-766(-)
MADRGDLPNFGIDAELAAKKQAGRDAAFIQEAYDWVSACMGLSGANAITSLKPLQTGEVLCNLINKIKPGTITKITEGKEVKTVTRAAHQENLSKFIKAAQDLGVSSSSTFQADLLYESAFFDDPTKDPKAGDMTIAQCIHALGSAAAKHGWNGPQLGIKISDPNNRNFDEATLRAGESMLTKVSAGSTGGASQAGMVDTSRNIVKANANAEYPK